MDIPALDNTYGAMTIGVILAAALFGLSCTQVWHYFRTYPADVLPLKILVATVFVLDLAHQILICHTLYTYVITRYGNPAGLTYIVPTLLVQILTVMITFVLVEGYFVYRIWALSKHNYYITGTFSAMIFTNIVLMLYYVYKCFQITSFSEYHKVQVWADLANISAAVIDLAVSATIIVLLHRKRTGHGGTNGLIARLMTFVLTTGLLTSGCAIVTLITNYVSPNSFIWMTFFFVLDRLYANSLFATLNARSAMRNALAPSGSGGGVGVGAGWRNHRVSGITFDRAGANIAINIEQTTISDFVEMSKDLEYGGAR